MIAEKRKLFFSFLFFSFLFFSFLFFSFLFFSFLFFSCLIFLSHLPSSYEACLLTTTLKIPASQVMMGSHVL